MELPIEEIEVGERRRQEMGDLTGLAASIRRYGLLHPVVIDEANHLVAGGRRLAACEVLGWDRVLVRRLGELTEQERREIELEENLRRKDLTAYEQARELVRKAPIVAEAISTNSVEKAPQGRKSDYPAPKKDVAQALGVSTTALVEAEQHVATADAYPVLQGPEWRQSHVLGAREALEKLPEPEREAALAMVSETFVVPKKAVTMLDNLAEKTPEERAKIFELHRSGDERKHNAAMSMAASGKVFPDLRAATLKTVIDELKGCIRMFPEDVLVPKFREAVDLLAALKLEVEQLHQERIHGSELA